MASLAAAHAAAAKLKADDKYGVPLRAWLADIEALDRAVLAGLSAVYEAAAANLLRQGRFTKAAVFARQGIELFRGIRHAPSTAICYCVLGESQRVSARGARSTTKLDLLRKVRIVE